MRAKTVLNSINESNYISDKHLDDYYDFEHELISCMSLLVDDEDEVYEIVEMVSDQFRNLTMRLFKEKLTPKEAAEKFYANKKIQKALEEFRSFN